MFPPVDKSSKDRPLLLPTPGMEGGAKKLISASRSEENISVSLEVIPSMDKFFVVRCDHGVRPTTPKATFSPPPPSMEYPATPIKYFTPSNCLIFAVISSMS